MVKGVFYALAACLIWGLIFVIPQLMSSFSAIEIVVCRYLFFGAISLLFLIKGWMGDGRRYSFATWMKALTLSFLSGYYLWVVLAIRYTSAEVCALVLGISPITIALYGNWKEKEVDPKLIFLPFLCILVGLMMINLPHISVSCSFVEYGIGLTCSLVALASWSVYVVLNARYLKQNAHVIPSDWASIQGVATVAWVALLGSGYQLFLGESLDMSRYLVWSPETVRFFAGCATLGILSSWGGAVLWNRASVHLPVSLAGQLMIFETIFGVLFAYILDWQLPSLMEASGITLLLGTVLYSIGRFAPKPVAA